MSLMTGLLIFAGVIGLVLLVVGIRPAQRNEIIAERLQQVVSIEAVESLADLEMAQPFRERVIFPILHNLGEVGNRILPRDPLNAIQKKLDMAGMTGRLEPGAILFMQAGGTVLFGGLIWLFMFVLSPEKWFSVVNLIIIFVGAIIGFAFPRIWLQNLINKRQKNVRLSMPDALDLLTICVEAGLGFDAAMAKVADKWKNEMSITFGRVLKEMQLGKTRREALKTMAERINIPELTSFVAAVIQSEQLGASMAKVLRIQSDQMRLRRRQHAEEEAHKTPIKMLIPMAILIFPSIIILIMTPAALKLMHSAAIGMFK
jgi:tight adherence protein C